MKVMVTGGTGYIGSWVVKLLLERGHEVFLSIRDLSHIQKYRHIEDIEKKHKGKLHFFKADLLQNGSFDDVANQVEAIIHMASPFTLRFKDPVKDLIEPAVKGTKNVLSAASRSKSVKRVVLTSSIAAVHGDNIDMKEQHLEEFSEAQFNTSSSQWHQPYSYSKVMAEKEAWKMYNEQGKWSLVVINPTLVMGPSLSETSNSESLALMHDILTGKYRFGVPKIYFGFVDVRDVAMAHVLALENKSVKGRHILVERVASIMDITKIVGEKFPNRFKLPKVEVPKFLLYTVGWAFGLTAKFIKRNVGYKIKISSKKSVQDLGLTYTPLETTICDMVEQMELNKK
ncbi:MAG TPA: NAD-dependent epimerase/dehydratase family protein [Tenuifilaceae bacterium]|nr:NAD-dependent epimerase/dehydratase family protein [Tenuifilaceae bacterium]